jgi:hypothetical protein
MMDPDPDIKPGQDDGEQVKIYPCFLYLYGKNNQRCQIDLIGALTPVREIKVIN